MRWTFPLALGAAAVFAAANHTKSDSEIEAFAASLLEPGKRHLNIEPAEGAYLRDLVRKVRAKRALEVGTSTGYSGIWIAMGLRDSGGKLITLEVDRGRHETAGRNFAAAGLGDYVDARLGDALAEIPRVEGPIDLVFLDAVKSDYLKYYELALPKVRSGGVIVAHNVRSHPGLMQDFLARIKADPKVRTEIVTPGSQGFSVSYVR